MNIGHAPRSLALRAASRLGGSNRFSRLIMKGAQIEVDPAGGTALGCVSVDFVSDSSQFDANRKGTLALLEVVEGHDIPVTWSICGVTAERDMRSYNAILNSTHDHEIAVHTYSPLDATNSTREEFRADIQRCITTLGLDSPRSFVFPWNREGHFDVLNEFGFKAFRGSKRAIGPPVLRDGIWNVRPVCYFDAKSENAEEVIDEYLEICNKNGGVFHIWTRPSEFAMNGETSAATRAFDLILSRMDELKKESKLITSTMGGISYLMDSVSGQAVPLAAP